MVMRIQQLELQPLNKYTIVLIPILIPLKLKEIKFRLDKMKKSHNTSKLFLMNTLLWNCRGMNKPSFYIAFKELVDYHKPVIVVLTKTKIDKARLPSYLPNLRFPNHDLVDAQGSSGVFCCFGLMIYKLRFWVSHCKNYILRLR